MTQTKYDFDSPISREGSDDLMHGALATRWGRTDLTPLWVADMNFAVLPEILDAMKQRLEHPVLGYTMEPADYRPAIIDWVRSHHQWEVKPEWISFVPGIVKGIGFVLNVFTQPGDKVIVLGPVYHLFQLTVERNNRTVAWSPLKEQADGRYDIDFDSLEQCAAAGAKVLLLCNPHNPIGICWSRETLQRLAAFCKEHGILVVSDEIHCDLAMFGHKHVPFASVSAEAEEISITFQAPTKTFNIAGVVSSYIIVSNPTLRRKLYTWMAANELDEPHIFAPIVTIAAYRYGEAWRQQMIAYVEDNIRFVEDYCREHMPKIKAVRPEASFLIWLDCRELGLNHEQLISFIEDGAHLALNDGEMFGPGGQGHMRLNSATQRAVLEQAMEQMRKAYEELGK